MATYEGQSWGQLTVRPNVRSSAASDCTFVIVSGEIHSYSSVTCELNLSFKVETEELLDSIVPLSLWRTLKTAAQPEESEKWYIKCFAGGVDLPDSIKIIRWPISSKQIKKRNPGSSLIKNIHSYACCSVESNFSTAGGNGLGCGWGRGCWLRSFQRRRMLLIPRQSRLQNHGPLDFFGAHFFLKPTFNCLRLNSSSVATPRVL